MTVLLGARHRRCHSLYLRLSACASGDEPWDVFSPTEIKLQSIAAPVAGIYITSLAGLPPPFAQLFCRPLFVPEPTVRRLHIPEHRRNETQLGRLTN